MSFRAHSPLFLCFAILPALTTTRNLINIPTDICRDVYGLVNVLAAFGYAEHLLVSCTLRVHFNNI